NRYHVRPRPFLAEDSNDMKSKKQARFANFFFALVLGSATAFGQATNAGPNPGSAGQTAPQLVVMKLVDALRNNDYRQALDTIYIVQQQIGDIQRGNPRVLW